MQQLAVIDFETTGLRAGADRAIEVAAVLMRGGVITDTFSELIDPGFRIPSFITSLTGITDAMVRSKPGAEVVMPRLRTFLGDHVCIAHNASFDRRFFVAEMDLAGERHDRPFLCSMLLARRLLPEVANHRLSTLVQHLRLEKRAHAHRAMDDVLMTCDLWQHLIGLLLARLPGRPLDQNLLRAVLRKPKAAVEAYLASMSAPGQAG